MGAYAAYFYIIFTGSMVACLVGLCYWLYVGKGKEQSEAAKHNMMDDD